MTTRHGRPGPARLPILLVAAATLAGMPAARLHAGQMVTFDQPPSVQDLATALGIRLPSRTRSIVLTPPEAAAPARPTRPAQPAQAAAAPPAEPSPRQDIERAVGIRIPFDLNSAAIQPRLLDFIRPVADLLAQLPQMELVIEGHTDSTGSRGYNMQLSQRRAIAVRDALVAQYGIAASRLSAVGKGPTRPLLQDDPANGANRRVEFRFRNI
ncbi:OmpA domain protein [Rhodovastum atsumiense]|nr:OmpA family protein [Rhodovastum atsumiense]CAH2602425.1 OmpA domain protein [Rhodovastum atsumiense]